jgi:hypothetical protein
MLNSRKEVLSNLGGSSKGQTPIFSPKNKGTTLNSTPKLNPVLAGLAFNRRKKQKLS